MVRPTGIRFTLRGLVTAVNHYGLENRAMTPVVIVNTPPSLFIFLLYKWSVTRRSFPKSGRVISFGSRTANL